MGRCAARAALALVAAFSSGVAQDTVATTRHLLGIDFARVRPFTRLYDVFVQRADSLFRVGERTVSLTEVVLPDSTAGWLLTEMRTGLVPSLDSLLLASDLRPVGYIGTLGRARLWMEFDGDSVFGAAEFRTSSSAIALPAAPDLVAASVMLDLIVTVLPLSLNWADSVTVLSATLAGASVAPAEFAVIGDEPTPGDSTAGAWLMSLRSEGRSLQLAVDKPTGALLRVQQSAPAHVGTLVEYRLRVIPDVSRP